MVGAKKIEPQFSKLLVRTRETSTLSKVEKRNEAHDEPCCKEYIRGEVFRKHGV